MILLIIKLLILEVFICINAWIDWLKIKEEWKLKHGIEGLSQGLFMAGLTLFYNWNLEAYKDLLFFLCLFWLQFDFLLNWMRHKKWYHLGTNIFDKILRGRNLRYLRLSLKIILVIGSFILMVL